MKRTGCAIVVTLGVHLLLSAPHARAQSCCSCSAPLTLGAAHSGVVPVHRVTLTMGYDFADLGAVYSGSQRLDDSGGRSGSAGNLTFEAGYGVSHRWSVHALSSYVRRERTDDDGTGTMVSNDVNGVGDAVVFAKFAVVPYDPYHRAEVAIGGGVKAPVGDYQVASGGESLARDLQPGSGAWDAILWGYARKDFRPGGWFGLANVTARLTGTAPDDYKVGNEVAYFAATGYHVHPITDALIQARYRSARRDQDEFGGIEGTGGRWLTIGPAVNIHVAAGMTLGVQYRYLVWADVHEEQLVPEQGATISLLYGL